MIYSYFKWNNITTKYNQMASIPVQTGLLCSKLPRQFWWVEALWKYHHKPLGHERDWTPSSCTPHTPFPYTGIKAHSFFHSWSYLLSVMRRLHFPPNRWWNREIYNNIKFVNLYTTCLCISAIYDNNFSITNQTVNMCKLNRKNITKQLAS